MSTSERPQRPGARWVIGAAGALIAASALACWMWGPAHRPSWEEIQAAAASGRLADAEAGLRRWLDARPGDREAWLMLGELLLHRGRRDEARLALGRVPEGHRGWVRAQTLLGEFAIQERRIAEAERAFRLALRRDPGAVEALRRLVYILVLERRTAEAHSALRRLFRATRDPRHLADSILVFRIEDDVRDLGPELEAFLHQTPDDPWLRRTWGLLLLSRGRPAEARPHLEAAASTFDDDPVGRFALAECRMALGDSGDDPSLLGTPPGRPVDAARWWVLRGRLEEARGRDDEAMTSLRQAVAADPRNHEALHRLGRLLVRRGDAEGGRDDLGRARAIRDREDKLKRELEHLLSDGFRAETLDRIGQLCQDAGLHAEASDWFELAARHDPRLRRTIPRSPPASATADDPPVALSRPVLRPSTLAPGPEPGPRLTSRHDPGPRFEDIARRAGVDFQYESGATPRLFIADTMGGGVALFDFDRDGWLDLYLVNGCTLPYDRRSPHRPNKLYRNRRDGTFEDVAGRAGVAGRGYGMGCTVADYDNDGYDDLFVTGLGETILYRNRGDGTFEDVTRRAGVSSSRWTTAAGFGDLDGDGDLDLIVTAYVEADPAQVLECRDEFGKPIHCPPDRFPAQLDHLFRNNGDGTFTDVSRESGIEIPDGRGLGLAIADLDDDGRLDLFVANDGTANFLFRNLGGLRFEEIAVTAGAAFDGMGLATASMGVVAEDLNGDGRIDLFHTNFINQTNTLRWNLGGGQFTDRTLAANLAAPSRSRTGFGTVALDADNDGYLDLFVANGHTNDQPWFNTPMAQIPQLFLGREHGRFEPAGPEVSPYFAHPVVGRGVAAGDLDNDGRVDLVVVHRDRPVALLHNKTAGGHWLGLRLEGTRSGRSPIGAHVRCRAGGRTFHRWLTSGTSYLSSSDPRLWFGLGSARVVQELQVRWPSGAVQTCSNFPADRILELQEGHDPHDAVRADRP